MYNCAVVSTFFGIVFLYDWNEKLTFSISVATAEFSKLAGILSAALSQDLKEFNLNSITFTSIVHSRYLLHPASLHIPGCLALGEWSHHRSYLDLKIFLYSSSVYSCHLSWIFSASVRSIPFLFFIVPMFVWKVPLVSLIFLKRSLVFPILLFILYFFALITEEGFLVFPCYSLELCIQMVICFLFSFAFGFSSFHSYL